MNLSFLSENAQFEIAWLYCLWIRIFAKMSEFFLNSIFIWKYCLNSDKFKIRWVCQRDILVKWSECALWIRLLKVTSFWRVMVSHCKSTDIHKSSSTFFVVFLRGASQTLLPVHNYLTVYSLLGKYSRCRKNYYTSEQQNDK